MAKYTEHPPRWKPDRLLASRYGTLNRGEPLARPADFDEHVNSYLHSGEPEVVAFTGNRVLQLDAARQLAVDEIHAEAIDQIHAHALLENKLWLRRKIAAYVAENALATVPVCAPEDFFARVGKSVVLNVAQLVDA